MQSAARRLGVVLPDKLLEHLDKDAKAMGETRSRRMAQIVAEALGVYAQIRRPGRPAKEEQ